MLAFAIFRIALREQGRGTASSEFGMRRPAARGLLRFSPSHDSYEIAFDKMRIPFGLSRSKPFDKLSERSGIRRDVRLRVPHYVAVGHILAGSDLVATVPQSLAERVAGPFGLSFVAHPIELPEFSINLFWHARFTAIRPRSGCARW